MKNGGRPLRFLVVVTGLWVGGRVAILWPIHAPPQATIGVPAPDRLPVIAKKGGSGGGSLPPFFPNLDPVILADRPATGAGAPQQRAVVYRDPTWPSTRIIPLPPRNPARIMLALLALSRFGVPATQPNGAVGLGTPKRASAPAIDRAVRAPLAAPRWSASGWLVWRGDGTDATQGLAPQPALGGSQAGFRFGYAVDDARRLSLFGRFSAPLSAPGRELAIGADWRPTALPVRLIAEQRIGLDGGARGGPTLGLVGGVGPVAVRDRLSFEAYGQAGVIGRDGGVGFADGSLRLHRHIGTFGPVDVTVGGGSWGGIQPGATRLDLGPTLGVDVPVAQRRLRFSLDWRERVIGNARPASGLALTLGADF